MVVDINLKRFHAKLPVASSTVRAQHTRTCHRRKLRLIFHWYILLSGVPFVIVTMTTIRSSVRPESSKQPWGTILKPEFGLGYQKMTEYEIEQTVNRLYTIPTPKEMSQERNKKELPKDKFDAMMERLTTSEKEKIPDSDRRINSSIYKEMGVVSSYAWKGYN